MCLTANRYDDKGDKKIYLPARNYSVAYQVKDTKGHINKGTLAVNAVNGVKVSGRVLAADGTGIDNATVVASFKNDNNKYYRNCLAMDIVIRMEILIVMVMPR